LPISKLKNIVILVLALVNVLLLALVLPLQQERRQQEALAMENLHALFDQYGITLHVESLPATESLYTLEFSPETDAALPAVQALLGEMVLAQDDSTQYLSLYRSDLGQCQISRSGQLEARLVDREAENDLSKAVSEYLEDMGVEVAAVSAPNRISAGVYTVQAVQQLLGVPVFSSTLEFTFHNSVLTRVEGTVYFDTTNLYRTDDVTCISCADALVAFLSNRDALGWVGSTVSGVTQGYLRTETASATLVRLVPGWQISTDTGSFWVNGITEQVTPLDA
jgi:hypothetical protein